MMTLMRIRIKTKQHVARGGKLMQLYCVHTHPVLHRYVS